MLLLRFPFALMVAMEAVRLTLFTERMGSRVGYDLRGNARIGSLTSEASTS